MTSNTDTYLRIDGEDYPTDSTEAVYYMKGFEDGKDNYDEIHRKPEPDSIEVINMMVFLVCLFEFLVILHLI
jgi:hypothetical protein